MSPKPRRVFRYRVYWEDTDAGGVVYHARYLHFLERARSDYLLDLGFPQMRLKEQTAKIFVVTRIETNFFRPAHLEDELQVDVRVESMKKASMVFAQTIQTGDDPVLLSDAKVTIACVDANTFKPARLPEDLVAAIQPN